MGLGNLFPAFFQSLKTPLRSLSLLCIPGLTESHVDTVLSAVGANLKRLEIDGGRSSSNDAPLSVSREMFEALAINCKRLEYLSLCGVQILDLTSFHPLRLLSCIAGLKELVSKRNTHHGFTRVDEGYQEVSASEADMQYAYMFLKYGTQLETFRGDFSNVQTASIALGCLINLQLEASRTEEAATDGVPNRIKLQTVDMGDLSPDTIARAIQAGVREFEMSETTTDPKAMKLFLIIRSALLRRGGFRFPHEVVCRFSRLGKCFYAKPYDHGGAVDLSRIVMESGGIGSDYRYIFSDII